MFSRLAIAAALVIAAPAAAVTVVIDQSASLNNVSFYQTSQTISLGAGFNNALINITSLGADDAAIITVNGTSIFGTGIFGPGNGNFFFTAGGTSVPFAFAANGSGGVFSAPFVVGNNIIEVFYNNNNAGINTGNGGLTGGPGRLDLVGTVTFDAAVVPEPSSWVMLIAGFGLIGAASRRRRLTHA